MGDFNEILSSRFNNLLRNFMPVDEQEGARTLNPEIQADLTLEAERAEWSWLKNERLCNGYAFKAAVVGQDSYVGLLNPANSGLIVVPGLKVAVADIVASQGFNLSLANQAAIGAFAVSTTSLCTDSRFAAAAQAPGAQVITGSAVGVLGALYAFGRNASANTSIFEMPPVVLHPGFALLFTLVTANQQLTVNWQWRERGILPGERP